MLFLHFCKWSYLRVEITHTVFHNPGIWSRRRDLRVEITHTVFHNPGIWSRRRDLRVEITHTVFHNPGIWSRRRDLRVEITHTVFHNPGIWSRRRDLRVEITHTVFHNPGIWSRRRDLRVEITHTVFHNPGIWSRRRDLRVEITHTVFHNPGIWSRRRDPAHRPGRQGVVRGRRRTSKGRPCIPGWRSCTSSLRVRKLSLCKLSEPPPAPASRLSWFLGPRSLLCPDLPGPDGNPDKLVGAKVLTAGPCLMYFATQIK
ncbi:uncharacterized protein [Gorilla gorilla gorilla]|uniref:uncharacterized protein isoform X2 n=1 Tax=Gorilla gorilla gorilla TaxID=9595 RepID=UPI0024456A94|nr:uncharacterized protein LOC115933369 isoform X2 [Gorilla gorilla gorilla]